MFAGEFLTQPKAEEQDLFDVKKDASKENVGSIMDEIDREIEGLENYVQKLEAQLITAWHGGDRQKVQGRGDVLLQQI